MDLDLPDDVAETIQQLEHQIGDIEQMLEPLLNSNLDEIHARLTPLESAKLNVATAFTLNALFYSMIFLSSPFLTLLVYLKTQGADPTTHPVTNEFVSLKSSELLLIPRHVLKDIPPS